MCRTLGKFTGTPEINMLIRVRRRLRLATQQTAVKFSCYWCFGHSVRIRLYWRESDIASRLVYKESDLMLILSSKK